MPKSWPLKNSAKGRSFAFANDPKGGELPPAKRLAKDRRVDEAVVDGMAARAFAVVAVRPLRRLL
ncbi:hypothetical protein BQ8794_30320 [Mesorhizobium prunaredense]|uniref:Uncharacterized protein n=2 Tax=Mesorhizobium TaxID=68287 RepID=A0A1R3VEP1_9HYPH|nr:hypothetical protein BQ8794_30320 [Mesorhizobium prunaredense]SJM31154.1 hypothetical protein BQ8482_180382 [Mesorhizobium delmotii]